MTISSLQTLLYQRLRQSNDVQRNGAKHPPDGDRNASVRAIIEQFWIDVQANLESQESIKNAEINLH